MERMRVLGGVLAALLAVGTLEAQRPLLHPQEVRIKVLYGMGNETLVFRTRSTLPVVWDRQGRITQDPTYAKPADLVIKLDPEGNFGPAGAGWDLEGAGNEPHLGRGEYEVSVVGHAGGFTIDCYGTEQVTSGDVVVTYYADQDIFDPDWVDYFDAPERLQPMAPPNFHCTNAGRDHENPHLCWDQPPMPEPEVFTYRYDVYRRRPSQAWRQVAAGLSQREWTDEEVFINHASGVDYLYCATAYNGLGPESPYSQEASIVGDLGKRVVDSGVVPELESQRQAALWVYPNPCNPVATVRYVVPEEGEVGLALYDLGGREVAQLAAGRHAAGEYQACLDGRALSSGVYVVRMACGGHALSAKVLVVK